MEPDLAYEHLRGIAAALQVAVTIMGTLLPSQDRELLKAAMDELTLKVHRNPTQGPYVRAMGETATSIATALAQ